LLGERSIDFELKKDLIFHQKIFLPFHPNGMTFEAYDQKNKLLQRETFFSVGGGFVQREGEEQFVSQHPKALFPFTSGKELLHFCQIEKCSISQLMWKNEMHWAKNNSTQIEQGIDNIMAVMLDCIERGQKHQGVLPGALKVKRRAWDTHQQLLTARKSRGEYAVPDPLEILDWVNLFALAVNEENAAGGKVVTAPTNGAAGIVPAVLQYYLRFCPGATREKARAYLLTASAIGILYKLNASISGAEVGCQGEVGVACSMAAAGLCEVSGGNIWQVENAAEIAMEHNLGLTCDPVGGLVQIPCIERNAMGAVKAINASRLALKGDGQHHISLDQVIKTMRQTGLDMQSKYKETSQGGLAVNFTEC
jgi:L-serine dehydratase